MKFKKYESDDKRYLDCEIKVYNFEDADMFLSYLAKKNITEWWGCLDEFEEDTNILTLHSFYEHGEMRNRKEDIIYLWNDFSN